MEAQNETFLKNEEDIIVSQMDELTKDLEAIKRLRTKYSNGASLKSENKINGIVTKQGQEVKIVDEPIVYVPVKIPTNYDKETLTWEERCIFILNELGKCTVNEVVKKIRYYEPNVSAITARNVATNKLSKMYRTHKIKADISKKRYRYYL